MSLSHWLWKKRMKESEFAKLVDLSDSYIRNLVAGRYFPTKKVAVRVYKATEGAVRLKYIHWVCKHRKLKEEDVLNYKEKEKNES